ncbi:MAG: PQQ-like beta-propeller repeat protein [Verrucomicrobiae bacterium]|nr:PQQ-like beta-propeller repeat protein [Verrucomicrobiae bacterium]
MAGPECTRLRVPAWSPWAAAALAVLIWLGWWFAPLRTHIVLRVPGSDRLEPSATTGIEESIDVFQEGRLETGPGRPADLPGSWPGFRGARGDGVQHDPARLAREWPAGRPLERWAIEVGEGFAGPAIDRGRIFLMDYDRANQRDALRCISLADGSEIWRYSYPVAIKRNHGLTRTVPSVAGDRVIAMGPRCHVVAVETDTGAFRWGLDLVRDFGTTVPPWYTGQCPLVDGDRVILAPGGPDALLMAVHRSTGDILWRTPNPHDWKMTHSSVVPFVLEGRRFYLYCASGGVVAADADTGSIAWETGSWRINIATVPSPVIADDAQVFLTGGYNAGSLMLAFTLEAGRLEAREVFRLDARTFGATQHTPIWYRGHLYGIRADGRLVCLDRQGAVVWESGPGANFGLGPLIIADGLILALNDSAQLTIAEAVPTAYRPLASASLMDGHEAWAPLALAGSHLLARDLTRMVCLQIGASP